MPRVLLRGAATTAAAATTDTSWCTAGASRSRPEAEGGWTSREEQLLLNAIEQFGYGNWEDMATHVRASQTPQEVMEHYTSWWLSSSSWTTCLCGTTTRSSTTRTLRRSSPGSRSTTAKRCGGRAEARARAQVRAQAPERQRCKNIARDYNLVSAFLGKEKERAVPCKVTKEKELLLKLQPVYQFVSCKEFDDLFEKMHKEKLQRYQRNCITKMEESAEYEAPCTSARSARRTRRRRLGAPSAARRTAGTASSWPSTTFRAASCCRPREGGV